MIWIRLDCMKSSSEFERSTHLTQRFLSRPDSNNEEEERCEVFLSGTGPARPIKPRTDILTHPDNVIHDCTAGSPKGCKSYGDGNPIVVDGVTPIHGGWESQLQGEGG